MFQWRWERLSKTLFSIGNDYQIEEFSSILGTSTSSNNGFIFGISSNNGDTAPWIKLSANYIAPCCLNYDDGDWHHFVAVKNSSHIQFYIDGQSKYICNIMYVFLDMYQKFQIYVCF